MKSEKYKSINHGLCVWKQMSEKKEMHENDDVV